MNCKAQERLLDTPNSVVAKGRVILLLLAV